MVRVVVLACFGNRLFGFWAYVASSIGVGIVVTRLIDQPFLQIRLALQSELGGISSDTDTIQAAPAAGPVSKTS